MGIKHICALCHAAKMGLKVLQSNAVRAGDLNTEESPAPHAVVAEC